MPSSDGNCNPTFRLKSDRGDHVLRKNVAGPLLPIEQEFRVTQALAASEVSVLRLSAWCDDEGVVGTLSHLIRVRGRVLTWRAGFANSQRFPAWRRSNAGGNA